MALGEEYGGQLVAPQYGPTEDRFGGRTEFKRLLKQEFGRFSQEADVQDVMDGITTYSTALKAGVSGLYPNDPTHLGARTYQEIRAMIFPESPLKPEGAYDALIEQMFPELPKARQAGLGDIGGVEQGFALGRVIGSLLSGNPRGAAQGLRIPFAMADARLEQERQAQIEDLARQSGIAQAKLGAAQAREKAAMDQYLTEAPVIAGMIQHQDTVGLRIAELRETARQFDERSTQWEKDFAAAREDAGFNKDMAQAELELKQKGFDVDRSDALLRQLTAVTSLFSGDSNAVARRAQFVRDVIGPRFGLDASGSAELARQFSDPMFQDQLTKLSVRAAELGNRRAEAEITNIESDTAVKRANVDNIRANTGLIQENTREARIGNDILKVKRDSISGYSAANQRLKAASAAFDKARAELGALDSRGVSPDDPGYVQAEAAYRAAEDALATANSEMLSHAAVIRASGGDPILPGSGGTKGATGEVPGIAEYRKSLASALENAKARQNQARAINDWWQGNRSAVIDAYARWKVTQEEGSTDLFTYSTVDPLSGFKIDITGDPASWARGITSQWATANKEVNALTERIAQADAWATEPSPTMTPSSYGGQSGAGLVGVARSLNGQYSQAKRHQEGYFDCSSFVAAVMAQAGIPVSTYGSTTAEQITLGRKNGQFVDGTAGIRSLEIGDAVYFQTGANRRHVGIIVGSDKNGPIIRHASSQRNRVVEDPLKTLVSAYRVIGVRKFAPQKGRGTEA